MSHLKGRQALKLAEDLHNFRDYLEHLQVPYSEFSFRTTDLKEADRLSLFLFSEVACETTSLDYDVMYIEGTKTEGKSVSKPYELEKVAIRLSANLTPELHLGWSKHHSSFSSKVYGVILAEKDGTLTKYVDKNLSPVRHLRYLLSIH